MKCSNDVSERSVVTGLLAGGKKLFSAYAKQGMIILTGDVVSKCITFIISIILLRIVTPEEYSYFGAFITVLAMASQFTDVGVNQSFIRFYSRYHESDPDQASSYFTFTLRVKSVVLPVSAVIFFIISPALSIHVFHTDKLVLPFQLLSIGIVGNGILEFISSSFQARQQFKQLALLRISDAGAKILFIAIVIYTGVFSLLHVYFAYTFVPICLGGIAFFAAGLHRSAKQFDWREIGRELFHFGKWIAVASLATMLMMRLDMLLVQFLIPDDKNAVGLYSAANRLAQPFIVLTASVTTLHFPKAMALKSVDEIRMYVKDSFTLTIPVSISCALYIVLLHFFLPAFAPAYEHAYLIFLILSVGHLFTILANPITMLILTLGRSHIVAAISVVQLLLTVVSHTIFILWLGNSGAAVSTVLMWFLAGTGSLWYLYHKKHLIESSG